MLTNNVNSSYIFEPRTRLKHILPTIPLRLRVSMQIAGPYGTWNGPSFANKRKDLIVALSAWINSEDHKTCSGLRPMHFLPSAGFIKMCCTSQTRDSTPTDLLFIVGKTSISRHRMSFKYTRVCHSHKSVLYLMDTAHLSRNHSHWILKFYLSYSRATRFPSRRYKRKSSGNGFSTFQAAHLTYIYASAIALLTNERLLPEPLSGNLLTEPN